MALFAKNDSNPQEQGTVLLLQVPRTNEKKELAAEQMFASLHGLLLFPSERRFGAAKRAHISFEIAVLKQRIGFYVHVPDYLKEFVEEQIYAQYPTVQISEVTDYAIPPEGDIPTDSFLMTEMQLTANSALPIKTFQSFEVDPLAAITATLAKFEAHEEAWIQVVVRPASHNWHKRSEKYINNLRAGTTSTTGVFKALWTPPEEGSTSSPKLTEYDQARASGAEEKSHKLAFEASVRIVYHGNVSHAQASLRLQSIVASYKQFSTTYLNGFTQSKPNNNRLMMRQYQERRLSSKPLVFNIEEMATLYHLPHTNVETPYILWATSQTAEPPANLPFVRPDMPAPTEISPIAITNFRGNNTAFGMPRADRGRHLYILGQTGVGKSGLLELLTISDINTEYGFAVIDPHGDYAHNILTRIPESRAKDTIYFNPADTEFPIAFNPMEVTDPKLRTHTASELIGVLKRMFDSWGPRLEYILRYSLLALLEYPNATMLDITRILTDKKFRADVMKHVSDPVVVNFWTVEFATWNDKFAAEAVAPVLNKVGAFTANPLVRNIIGQPKSSFNIREIMDKRKILIVNLSRGLVGEDNAALLGALMVTKIQLASMSRADIPASERIPFYLYVDEFQHFATDSFATILSESRKYNLNLTVANQYIAQMSQEVKDAVFGNVGSVIAFRMGVDDARGMQRYFDPIFTEYDLVHMHNRHFVINMTINGEKSQAFSATTLDLPELHDSGSDRIIANSRAIYALPRVTVDAEITRRYHDLVQKAKPTQSPKQPQPPIKQDEPATVRAAKNPELDPGVLVPEDASKVAKAEREPESGTKLKDKISSVIGKSTGVVGKAAVKAVAEKDSYNAEESPRPKRKRTRRRRGKKQLQNQPQEQRKEKHSLTPGEEFVIFSKDKE